jgi:hypothetical protein
MNANLVRLKKPNKSIKELQIDLAKYLIQIDEGKRLPSIRKLADSTEMSIGSISKALNGLQEIGAVQIQKRGHMGSVMVSRSIGELWNLVEQGPLVIAMTLPMHSRFEGLATGLKKALEKLEVETYLIFIRGSRTRLKALKENRCHVAVMSGLAADELSGREHEILFRLPPGSWISGYCVFYRTPQSDSDRPVRLAVDPDSYDHRRLTELEFEGQPVDFRWAPFVQFSRLLKSGDVDAILWSSDQEDAYIGPGIEQRPLSEKTMRLVGEKSLSATFVGRSRNDPVRAVLQAAIDVEKVMSIQAKVIRGEIIPEY